MPVSSAKVSNERIFLDYKMAAVTTTNDTNILFRHQHLIYDPVTLKRFAINSNKLSPNVYQLLKETRLLRPGKRTKRGKRAGVIKVRNYDIITGSNQKNLKTVRITSCTPNVVTIGCVNVRSIRNKAIDLCENIICDGYDICLITETWLDCDESVLQVEATPAGYCFDHLPRSDRRGGGVGLICRKDMKPQKQQVLNMRSFEYCEWVLKHQSVQYLIVVVYRPPYTQHNKMTIGDFIEEFSNYLETIVMTTYKLIIGGDFNIHMEDACNTDTNKFIDLLNGFNLKNHVWSSTHERGHTLDLFITRNHDNIIVQEPEIMSFISDHAFVRARTTILRSNCDEKEISFRRMKSIDINKFKNDILSSDLGNMSGKSVAEMAKTYDKTLSNLLDAHAPLITKTIRIKSDSPWYNQGLRMLKRKKRKAERSWRQSHTVGDFDIFKKARAEYIKKCADAKTDYYSDKIMKCGGDQKQLYRLIGNLTEGERNVIYPDSTDNLTLSNDFAKYFITKIENIMSDIITIIESEDLNDTYNYEPASNEIQMLNFSPLTTDQVKKIIISSKSKSSRLDPIPTTLLKDCLDVLITPITNIVNASLENGVFPDNWKSALVVPLMKKTGLDPIFKNYRPVSNLTFVSKIIEKAGLAQYVDHLDNIGMSTSDNSAYKCHHSTETLLVKIFSDIVNNIDNKKVSMLVLLDLSAAFDTVNLSILSTIFTHRFDIHGNALNWFHSYLQNRNMRILIDNIISDYHQIEYGVPQGSCIGPVVFLGYLSSLYDLIKEHLPEVHVGGYADDHQLYIAYNPGDSISEQIALNRIQSCISDVRKWMLTHRLKINDLKTEFMIVGSKHQLEKVNIEEITVGTCKIKPVDCLKNLGVIFDQNLQMTNQINSICKRGYFQLRRIKQIRKYLDDSATESLIHSFVTSNIDYCNALLYEAPKSAIIKLQKLQNAAARVVCKARKFDHVSPILEKLHWLPVSHRITFKIALLTHRCVNKVAPDYLCDLIEVVQPTRVLRSNNTITLKIPRCKTQMGKRAFTSAAPAVWNSLPSEIRSLDFHIFKQRLKTLLFQKAYH